MKKLLIILTVLFLTACSYGDKPASQTKKPSIPTGKMMQANALGATDIKKSADTGTDVKKLIETINKNIEQENITAQDIKRGFYYVSSKEDKKLGTPNSWIWVNDGAKSRFISPNATNATNDIKIDELCRKTAGTYAISCIESETENCEYIPKSECRCVEHSKWVDNQGCILTKGTNFVKIAPEELQQGWYKGLNSEKKLDTPASWVWLENGKESKWKNAGVR